MLGYGQADTNSGGEDRSSNRTTTPKPTQQQKNSEQAKPMRDSGTAAEEETAIQAVQEVNDHLLRPDKSEGIGGSCVQEIMASKSLETPIMGGKLTRLIWTQCDKIL